VAWVFMNDSQAGLEDLKKNIRIIFHPWVQLSGFILQRATVPSHPQSLSWFPGTSAFTVSDYRTVRRHCCVALPCPRLGRRLLRRLDLYFATRPRILVADYRGCCHWRLRCPVTTDPHEQLYRRHRICACRRLTPR